MVADIAPLRINQDIPENESTHTDMVIANNSDSGIKLRMFTCHVSLAFYENILKPLNSS